MRMTAKRSQIGCGAPWSEKARGTIDRNSGIEWAATRCGWWRLLPSAACCRTFGPLSVTA
jgi:hypothetical protein